MHLENRIYETILQNVQKNVRTQRRRKTLRGKKPQERGEDRRLSELMFYRKQTSKRKHKKAVVEERRETEARKTIVLGKC